MWLKDSCVTLCILTVFYIASACCRNTDKSDSFIQRFSLPFSGTYAHVINSSLDNSHISQSCRDSLLILSNGLVNSESWAAQFIDSSSKLFGSYKKRKFNDFGNFDLCHSVQHHQHLEASLPDDDDTSKHRPSLVISIRGKYSLIKVDWPDFHQVTEHPEDTESRNYAHKTWRTSLLPAMIRERGWFDMGSFSQGLCHPHVCTPHDIRSLIQPFVPGIKVKVVPGDENKSVDVLSRLSLMTLTLIIITSLTSTLLKYSHLNRPNIMSYFDISDNYERFIRPPEITTLQFMNGVKSMYLILAIYVHLLVPLVPSNIPVYDGLLVYLSSNHYAYLARGGSLAVQLPILISSVLFTVNWFWAQDKTRLNFGLVVFSRWLRVLPLTLTFIMMIFASSQFSGTNYGPNFHDVIEGMCRNCYKHGWAEILNLSNIFSAQRICLSVGWIVAADFHLMILTYPLLLVFRRDERSGWMLGAIYVIIGILIEFLTIVLTDSMTITDFADGNIFDQMQIVHFGSQNYMTCYIMGIFLGYLVYSNKKLISDQFASKIMIVPCLFVIFNLFIVMYVSKEWTLNRTTDLMIGCLHKTFITGSLASVGFLMWHQKTSLFSRLYTGYYWDLLSKLTYPSFVSHMLIISWLAGIRRSTFDHTLSQTLQYYFLVLTSSLMMGLAIHLMIEVPFNRMAKDFIFNRKRTSVRISKGDTCVRNSNKKTHGGHSNGTLTSSSSSSSSSIPNLRRTRKSHVSKHS